MSYSETFWSITAFSLHILIFLTLCSVESIFFSPRSSLVEVDLWMVSLVFWGLHRNLLSSVLFTVSAAMLLGAFSGIPFHSTLLSFLGVLAIIQVIKSRSYAQGASYFVICSFFALLSFYSLYFLTSWILGDAPIEHPHIIQWVTSALTSSALFALIRPLLISVDRLCQVKYPYGFEVEQ